jgi:hypothetical protein
LGATTGLGTVSVITNSTFGVTGVYGTGYVGTPTTEQGVVVAVVGSGATGSVGTPTVTNVTLVDVTGVYATGETSGIQIWMEIVPGQTPNWVEIAA